MNEDKQKLNDEKTEVVLFGTRQQLEKLGDDNTFEIKIGSEVIKPTPSARNLGFHMEAQLKSQNTHIKSMWYSCLLYTSPSPRDATLSRMPSSA